MPVRRRQAPIVELEIRPYPQTGTQESSREFVENLQTALLLALLGRGLLTQRQFERCVGELGRAGGDAAAKG